MERKILAAANAEKQKYFLEPEFRELPESIQEEVRVICVLLAQKLNCTFLMGFDGKFRHIHIYANAQYNKMYFLHLAVHLHQYADNLLACFCARKWNRHLPLR